MLCWHVVIWQIIRLKEWFSNTPFTYFGEVKKLITWHINFSGKLWNMGPIRIKWQFWAVPPLNIHSDIHVFRILSGILVCQAPELGFYQFTHYALASKNPEKQRGQSPGWWVTLRKYECIAWQRESLFRGCVGLLGLERLARRALPASGQPWQALPQYSNDAPDQHQILHPQRPSTASTRDLRVRSWQAKVESNSSPSPM